MVDADRAAAVRHGGIDLRHDAPGSVPRHEAAAIGHDISMFRDGTAAKYHHLKLCPLAPILADLFPAREGLDTVSRRQSAADPSRHGLDARFRLTRAPPRRLSRAWVFLLGWS